jgi:hypothetical protein
VIGSVVLTLGLESSGINSASIAQKLIDDPNVESRDRSEVDDLQAHGATPHQPPNFDSVQGYAPTPPSRFIHWFQEPEISGKQIAPKSNSVCASSAAPAVTLQPAASPYIVDGQYHSGRYDQRNQLRYSRTDSRPSESKRPQQPQQQIRSYFAAQPLNQRVPEPTEREVEFNSRSEINERIAT